MNLWAKSLGRFVAFATALFFLSCEDESGFIGLPPPNKKFTVSYFELDLPSSVFSVDSIVTDNVSTTVNNSPNNVVGSYNDPVLGTMRAESYLQLAPVLTTKLESNAVFDSLTIQLRLNFYNYGFMGNNLMRFNVHEITGQALSLDTLKTRYYFNSTVDYAAETIGEIKVSVNKEKLDTLKQDTVLLSGRLANEFGLQLFNLALNDPNSTFSKRELFVQAIKGLAITPVGSNGILGFNPGAALSKIVLHYHRLNDKNEIDTLQRNFVFNNAQFALNPNFTNYTADRSATELSAITQPYQSYAPPSGLRAIQNGSPLATKIDLSQFYQFAEQDSVKNIIINSAELIISDVQSPGGLQPHNSLSLILMNNEDDRLMRLTNDRTAVLRNYYISGQGNRYYVGSENSSGPATLTYIPDDKKFSGSLNSFFQSLFRNKQNNDGSVNENRITYLALFPASPLISGTVNRTVFNGNNVKLRINYTQPAPVANNNK